MTAPRVIILGAGGHGKVIACALQARGTEVVGFVDDRASELSAEVMQIPVLGPMAWLLTEVSSRQAFRIALGIGDNVQRHALSVQLAQAGYALATVTHPAAIIAPSAELKEGTVVLAGAVINAEARVGRGVIVNTGAIVEHDTHVGDFAHLSPNAALGGGARVGAFAHLGIGSIVLPRVSIGDGTILGAGGVAHRDLPPDVTAVGVPARIISSHNPPSDGARR